MREALLLVGVVTSVHLFHCFTDELHESATTNVVNINL